jgi:hypothetical protein
MYFPFLQLFCRNRAFFCGIIEFSLNVFVYIALLTACFMLKKERQSFILRQVNLHNKVLSTDLSQEMNVSEDTIRRDLNELSEERKIIKVHGGALSKSFHPIFILLMKKRQSLIRPHN